MKRPTFIAMLAILAPLVLAFGCGKDGAGPAGDSTEGEAGLTPTPGGILIWGRGADATKLDPGDITEPHQVTIFTLPQYQFGKVSAVRKLRLMRTVNWRSSESMLPAGSSMFSARSADSTSDTVRLRAASALRSSQMRMA